MERQIEMIRDVDSGRRIWEHRMRKVSGILGPSKKRTGRQSIPFFRFSCQPAVLLNRDGTKCDVEFCWLSSKTIIYVDVSYRVPGFLSCFIHSHISAKLAFQKHGDDDSQEDLTGPTKGADVMEPQISIQNWWELVENTLVPTSEMCFFPMTFTPLFTAKKTPANSAKCFICSIESLDTLETPLSWTSNPGSK